MHNAFLKGQSVYLRPLERADAPLLVKYVNDPAIRRTLLMNRPISLQEEEEFISRLGEAKDQVVLGIASHDGDRLLGVTGLHKIDSSSRQAEFGIFIGDPAEWGKGYGTETTALMVGYAFETLNLNRVWLHVFENNPAGIRAYEKVGFKREGVLRQGVFREGQYLDVVTMAVLRDEWKVAKR
jgi:diamine N-acetyltransferase